MPLKDLITVSVSHSTNSDITQGVVRSDSDSTTTMYCLQAMNRSVHLTYWRYTYAYF